MWMRYWNYISTQTKENFNILRSPNLFLSLYQDKNSIFRSGFCWGPNYPKKASCVIKSLEKFINNCLWISFYIDIHFYTEKHLYRNKKMVRNVIHKKVKFLFLSYFSRRLKLIYLGINKKTEHNPITLTLISIIMAISYKKTSTSF